jgi:hypothetical protein
MKNSTFELPFTPTPALLHSFSFVLFFLGVHITVMDLLNAIEATIPPPIF